MTQILIETLATTLGSIAFSLFFGTPEKYYLECGLTGGSGWLLHRILMAFTACPTTLETFLSAAAVALYSRIAAVRGRCPTTVFLIAGIFPLIPGAGIYWTVYYLVTGEVALAWASGTAALKATFAIVLAITAFDSHAVPSAASSPQRSADVLSARFSLRRGHSTRFSSFLT